MLPVPFQSQQAEAAVAGSPHVLHVVPQLGIGGVELTLNRLLERPELSQMRHSVMVMRGPQSLAMPPGVKVHCLQSQPKERLVAWRLGKLLKSIRPDVIHARNWGAWLDTALANLLRWRAPLVYSFHGLSEQSLPLRRRMGSRLLAMATDHIFTVSQASRDNMAHSMMLPLDRIDVIPNGVDSQQFCPGAPRRKRSRAVVGNVASLTSIKNQQLLIRAVAAMERKGVKVEVWIAGEGPMRSGLRALIAELGLGQQVQLLGHVENVPAFLRQLDLFVLCSASEAHPNALLEAMACQVPCVATDVGGVAEVLGGGRYGMLCPSNHVAALAQAMIDILNQPARLERFAREGRNRVVERYSLQATAQSYCDLYQRMARA